MGQPENVAEIPSCSQVIKSKHTTCVTILFSASAYIDTAQEDTLAGHDEAWFW